MIYFVLTNKLVPLSMYVLLFTNVFTVYILIKEITRIWFSLHTDCGLQCENGGTPLKTLCTECDCLVGYTEFDCSEDIDECTMNATLCNNGNCMNNVGSFTCNCSTGFTGDICDEDINECLCSDCYNGATCMNTVRSYTCLCSEGFTGTLCDIECQTDPYVNDGTCNNTLNSSSCQGSYIKFQ